MFASVTNLWQITYFKCLLLKTFYILTRMRTKVVGIGQKEAAKLFWKFTSGQFLSGRLSKLPKGKNCWPQIVYPSLWYKIWVRQYWTHGEVLNFQINLLENRCRFWHNSESELLGKVSKALQIYFWNFRVDHFLSVKQTKWPTKQNLLLFTL